MLSGAQRLQKQKRPREAGVKYFCATISVSGPDDCGRCFHRWIVNAIRRAANVAPGAMCKLERVAMVEAAACNLARWAQNAAQGP